MLARVTVVLPFAFHVPDGASLKPIDLEWNGRSVRLYPPVQSGLLAQSGGGDKGVALSMIGPTADVVKSPYVRIDDTETRAADLFTVDFRADSFDRSSGNPPERDALVSDSIAVIDQWLTTFRNLLGATWVKPVTRMTCSWRLTYLNDDETELPKEEGQIRGTLGVLMRISNIAGLADEAWNAIAALQPGYAPFRWDELLVDAVELLPAVGPSLLLAYTALEIRISDAADVLAAEAKVHDALWEWFTVKRSFKVQPETAEFAKAIFRMLAGKSLADEQQLWKTLTDLRKARNSFAHEGVAVDTQGNVVTPEKAAQLVAGARQVLDWIETLLPEKHRRTKLTITTNLQVLSPPIKAD
jgi:hypothetical protein